MNLLDAGQSIAAKWANQPKWSAASSADLLTTGMFRASSNDVSNIPKSDALFSNPGETSIPRELSQGPACKDGPRRSGVWQSSG